jgi:hypothetical protein
MEPRNPTSGLQKWSNSAATSHASAAHAGTRGQQARFFMLLHLAATVRIKATGHAHCPSPSDSEFETNRLAISVALRKPPIHSMQERLRIVYTRVVVQA